MSASARKDGVIQIRAPRDAKALIMRAAELKHQKLSEFMLDSARRSAEETILDSNLLRLTEEEHAAFNALLDAPPGCCQVDEVSTNGVVTLTRPETGSGYGAA